MQTKRKNCIYLIIIIKKKIIKKKNLNKKTFLNLKKKLDFLLNFYLKFGVFIYLFILSIVKLSGPTWVYILFFKALLLKVLFGSAFISYKLGLSYRFRAVKTFKMTK